MMKHFYPSKPIPLIWVGVFWKIVSCGCFAGVNALVRYLSGGSSLPLESPLPIYIIMLFQNLFGTLFILPWVVQLKPRPIVSTSYPTLHIIRVTTAVLGIGLWYLSLRYIPITQVVALSFAGPIVTIFGAAIFLRENLNPNRWVAIAFTLMGGFLITRPDRGLSAEGIGFAALLPLCAACIFASDKLITRKLLANKEPPELLTLYLLAFMGPMCMIPTIMYGWVSPTMEQWPWLLLLGLLAMGAHFSFSKAYALAEVTFLMPFGMSKFILCGIIGFVVFGELPKTFGMWVGIIMLSASTMALSIRKDMLQKLMGQKTKVLQS